MKQDIVNMEVKFNLGSVILEMLGHLLRKANTSRLNHNYTVYFESLVRVRSIIVSQLSKEQLDKCTRLENEIGIAIHYQSKQTSINKDKLSIYLHRKLWEYEKEIMWLLNEKGYLVPTKEDRAHIFAKK